MEDKAETTLKLAGKAYGLLFSTWHKFQDIIEIGPEAAAAANPNFFSEL